MSIILRAAELAREAHLGQVRKYTGRPYIEHPARVAGKVALVPRASEKMVAAAFLHDVLEDTTRTADDIERATDRAVVDLVAWLTNPSKGVKAPRAARKQMDREHLSSAPWEARIIKLVDRLDNLLEMTGAPGEFRKLYGQESLLLVEALVGTDTGLEADLVTVARSLL